MIFNQPDKPPYVFQEYPKWVTNADGKAVIVKDRDEEDEVTFVETNDPEREALLAEAKELGLTIHPATKTEKLREKVAAAKG